MHKVSFGHVGLTYKSGCITSLVKDSSAARNGLLTDHNLLEVNGQNVVGLKDKEIGRIMDGAGSCLTLTVMPKFLYEHMIKKYVFKLRIYPCYFLSFLGFKLSFCF